MKKILVALAMFPLVTSAAELGVGTFQVKGASNLGFTSGSQKVSVSGGGENKTDRSNFNGDVQGFYYLTPAIGVGFQLGYSSATEKYQDGSKVESSDLLIGPAIALDHALTPEVSVFADAALGYASGSVKDSFFADTLKFSGFGLEIGAGVKYFLERHFSVDLGLAYKYLTMKSSQDSYGKPDVTNSDFGVKAGVSVYFGGK